MVSNEVFVEKQTRSFDMIPQESDEELLRVLKSHVQDNEGYYLNLEK